MFVWDSFGHQPKEIDREKSVWGDQDSLLLFLNEKNYFTTAKLRSKRFLKEKQFSQTDRF